MNLRHYLSATYSHLENRSLSVYWNARSKVIDLLDAQSTDQILELGSSSGNWSAYFAPKVSSWIGLEIDIIKIHQAHVWRSTRVPLFPNIEKNQFVCGSGEALPFADESFDKCFSTDVIEHIEDDYKVIREIYRILKPNGIVVMTTLLEERPHYLHRLEFPDHVREYTIENFADRFLTSGFEVKDTFFFYYAASMLAREIQDGIANTFIGSKPVIPLILSVPLRLMMEIDLFAKIGKPGGIGILAQKSD